MISVNNLSVQFSGNYLFDSISFFLRQQERIGLVGKNGAGKTTLMRILNGDAEPESGTVSMSNDCKVGFLPQEIVFTGNDTIFDEALRAFEEALRLDKKIKKLTSAISNSHDYHSEEYLKMLDQLTEASEMFAISGGNTMIAETEKVLIGLGFERSDFTRHLTEFSGGWRMRVELAKILLRKPELLLLDEPTNHLDIESIQWLESFLKSQQGAVLVVSHDRAFLDSVTQRTIEISNGKIYDYKASYSDYVVLREERITLQQSQKQNQQKEIAQIERFVERFRYKATKSKQVQSRIKMLDKMDIIDIDGIDSSAIHFSFPPAPSSGKVVVECIDTIKKYGQKLVLDKLNFGIIKGEKIAFVGKNGMGKTTLAKMIIGQLEYDGALSLGYNVKIGYYAQNQAELLDPDKTVFETLDYIATGTIRTKLRSILGSFLFSGEDTEKKVKVLSGGEKSRLALATLLLSPVNLLVLDEPTNHLDMRSKDILKMALLKYDGTLIIVSHDRDFMQGLTSKVFEFRNHGIKEYLGDIYDFLDSRRIESLKHLELPKKKTPLVVVKESNTKESWEKKKQAEKGIKRINQQISKCEEEISELETDIKKQEDLLATPEIYADISLRNTAFSMYDVLQKRLKEKMLNWEKLHQELSIIET